MQIYFHSWVSPGVQDLPGNNIHYGHPVKNKKTFALFIRISTCYNYNYNRSISFCFKG